VHSSSTTAGKSETVAAQAKTDIEPMPISLEEIARELVRLFKEKERAAATLARVAEEV